MEIFFLYILYSKENDRIYIGQTNDIDKRLKRHNSGYEKATKAYIPWVLIYIEDFTTREDALQREKYWKQSNNRRRIRNEILRNYFYNNEGGRISDFGPA
jgi:putative endonuclease